MKNFSTSTKMTRHSNAVAAGTSDITPSAGINMADFDGCIFVVQFGTLTSTAVTSIEVHQSSDNGDGDSFTAILGTKVTVADDDDNKVFYVDITAPTEQYLKCIVNRGTANAVLDGIMAIQYGPAAMPTTHDSTIKDGELHVGAAEGTA